jgi:hypothetical protein
MRGQHRLDREGVREFAPDANGVYVIIRAGEVSYVGRGNLKARLSRHAAAERGDYFCFRRVRSEVEGFRRECALFHKYGKAGGLDNDVHPARPKGRSDLGHCSLKGCSGEDN